jgi:protein-S-isoprenylcysteine O-methyltransferase Ste14
VPTLVRIPLAPLLAGWVWLDVVVMPALSPLVRLGPSWMVGEAVGLVAVALPAALLGRWVADRRRLVARATLQMAVFGALVLWLIPATAIELGDGSWRYLLELPRWQFSLAFQAVGLASVPGVVAVREFVERGGGTPYPWDPPVRMVTSGPYAYVANPMQLSGTALLLLGAALTHSWSLVGAAVSGVAFAIAVADPHEDKKMTGRHGAAWSRYRSEVRAWWPRRRPYQDAPARLYLSATCPLCASTATALAHLGPAGVTTHPAEEHRRRLRRARYEGADGYAASGVAALARALEHTHLGWAFVGWVLRVPIVDVLAQVIVDGLGGGPRDLPVVRSSPSWPTRNRS